MVTGINQLVTDFCYSYGELSDKQFSVEEELSLSSKKERAKECLRLLLAEDDIPSVEILKQMKEMNISPRTVRTAQKELGVMAYRKENAWYWHIDKVRE